MVEGGVTKRTLLDEVYAAERCSRYVGASEWAVLLWLVHI